MASIEKIPMVVAHIFVWMVLVLLSSRIPRKSHVGVIAAAAAGGITFTSIIVGIFLYYMSRGVAKRKADDPEGNRGSLAEWIRQLSDDLLLHTAVDKTLPGNGFDHELNQFLKVACKCVVENAKERPTMFEVHQLLRAIGERYYFTTEDDIILPSYTGDTAFPDELIVANEVTREVD
ncbi:hypothetical protein OIU85_006359 [Salix viminalis]|uniref:Uncharacterized protein n=1 Tax=Salix viminalis TaxID=40686 RepID=A0A9Q0PKR4_SALVM|nr:hypothetical protein OIU85_006359 [Salix viminalis]